MLSVGSLFDGIGCFSLAFVRAGWRLAWTVEIDADCRRVTRERFPGVPQFADVREVGGHNLEPVDVVVGGSPCQDWSVAGRRAGLDGGRAPLFAELARVAREVGARWILWENVPGVLSQCKGCDFARVLGEFTGCEPAVPPGGWRNTGWGWGRRGACCWRVCDARHWGVPQRRRRVFALVRLGDFGGLAGAAPRPDLGRLLRLPAEVLLEPEGVFGHPPPRPRPESGVAPSVTPGARRASGSRSGEQLALTHCPDVAFCLPASARGTGDEAHTVTAGTVGHNNASIPLVFQASGAGSFRAGLPMLSASDDNGTNQQVVCATGATTHAPQSVGCDAGEDGTGRGTPIVAFHATQDPISGDVAPALGRGGNERGSATAAVAYNIVSLSQQGRNHAYEAAVSGCLQSKGLNPTGNEAGTVVAYAELGEGHQTYQEADVAPAVRANAGGKLASVVAFQERGRDGGRSLEWQEEQAYSLTSPRGGGRAHENNIHDGMVVRRLTPVECLRLQGLPDSWLDVEPPLSDGKKYAMIGNGGVTHVVEWIARRLRAACEGRAADEQA